jgi:hypothetical protein
MRPIEFLRLLIDFSEPDDLNQVGASHYRPVEEAIERMRPEHLRALILAGASLSERVYHPSGPEHARFLRWFAEDQRPGSGNGKDSVYAEIIKILDENWVKKR